MLPPVNGRQLVAFVPKDGNLFDLDSQNLGNYLNPLTLVTFADALNHNGNDTKVAIAFFQTPDYRNLLIVGVDSNGALGGFAAFELDAAATPPTVTKLWRAPTQLRDSFGSPTVIANPVPDQSTPPNPLGLAWIIDGDDAGNNFLNNCAIRAHDVLTGTVFYDSTVHNDVMEQIPHFAPIASGGNSVFCATSKENPGLPDKPQGFLFPFTISFTGDQGFKALVNAPPPIGSTFVTPQGSLTIGGTPLSNSTPTGVLHFTRRTVRLEKAFWRSLW